MQQQFFFTCTLQCEIENQIYHGSYFTFSIATTESVILGDNNSTEESSQFFWNSKSYPHVALQCSRQWDNMSKCLSSINFCGIPGSVSRYAVCSQLSWSEKKRKHCGERYVKYIARVAKLAQSVVATLDKTSKGKCTPHFFIPGKDI